MKIDIYIAGLILVASLTAIAIWMGGDIISSLASILLAGTSYAAGTYQAWQAQERDGKGGS